MHSLEKMKTSVNFTCILSMAYISLQSFVLKPNEIRLDISNSP